MNSLKAIVFGLVVRSEWCTHVESSRKLEFEVVRELQGGKGEVGLLRCLDQAEDTGWKSSRSGASGRFGDHNVSG